MQRVTTREGAGKAMTVSELYDVFATAMLQDAKDSEAKVTVRIAFGGGIKSVTITETGETA